MANIMQNRVDAILKPDQMLTIVKHIESIVREIPDIQKLTLTPDQAISTKTIDVDNKIFVEDAINVIKHIEPGILPNLIKYEQIQNDLTLFEQMDEIYMLLLKALVSIGNVRHIAGGEALGVSNAAYKLLEIAAAAGMPGAQAAYDKLKERYERSSGGPQKED